jgi:uncharacterized protein YecE (DUF72 family)
MWMRRDKEKMREEAVLIGTSGWSYRHWKGPFYPGDLPAERYLPFYAGRFPTVEINSTFYRLPEERTLAQWRDCVPDGFVFAVKGSGFITHRKKLRDPLSTLPPFFARIAALRDKLGPVLFQLPPRWGFDPERFTAFLRALSGDFRYVFEFRDPGWFTPSTREELIRRRAAFCIYDLGGRLSPEEVTADFAYVRLHGPAGPYRGLYDAGALAGWARKARAWSAEGKRVYCYFNNDQEGFAARNALQLQEMLRRE